MSDEKKPDEKTRRAEPKDEGKAFPTTRDTAGRGPAIATIAESYVDRKVAEAEAKKYTAEGKLYRAKADTAEAWEELKKQEVRHNNMDAILEQVEDEIHAEKASSELKRLRAEADRNNFEREQKTKRAKQSAERAEALLSQKDAMRALKGRKEIETSVEEELDHLHGKLHALQKEKEEHIKEQGELSESEATWFNKKEAMLIRKIQSLEGDL